MKSKDYPTEYLEFIVLFNRGKFFEAHEVLELRWRNEKGQRRDYYQGLIQVAAVFVHILKETPEGGKRLLETATVYLEKYMPKFMDLDLDKLLRETRRALLENSEFPQITLE